MKRGIIITAIVVVIIAAIAAAAWFVMLPRSNEPAVSTSSQSVSSADNTASSNRSKLGNSSDTIIPGSTLGSNTSNSATSNSQAGNTVIANSTENTQAQSGLSNESVSSNTTSQPVPSQTAQMPDVDAVHNFANTFFLQLLDVNNWDGIDTAVVQQYASEGNMAYQKAVLHNPFVYQNGQQVKEVSRPSFVRKDGNYDVYSVDVTYVYPNGKTFNTNYLVIAAPGGIASVMPQ